MRNQAQNAQWMHQTNPNQMDNGGGSGGSNDHIGQMADQNMFAGVGHHNKMK